MQQQSLLSRVARGRLELAARPPRPLWRVVGTVPILTAALLLLVRFTLAWFTSGTTLASNALTSGRWATLMTPGATSVTISGKYLDPYSQSFTLTSTAAVTLPLSVEWVTPTPSGSAPAVTFKDAQNQTVSTINAGQTLQVDLTGTYSNSFTGQLQINIGSAKYDWGFVTVGVTVQPLDFVSVITATPVCFRYKSDEDAKKSDEDAKGRWVRVMSVTQKSGYQPVPMTVSVGQATKGIYVWAGTTKPPKKPTGLSTTFDFTTPGNIVLWQGKNSPGSVSLTFTPKVPWLTPMTYTVNLPGSDDDDEHSPGCDREHDASADPKAESVTSSGTPETTPGVSL